MRFFIAISSVISLITSLFWDASPGYEFLPLLPLVFMGVYLFLLHHPLIRLKSIIAGLLTAYGYFRYILTPFFIVIASDERYLYFFTRNTESIRIAIFLMIFEVIVLSLVVYYVVTIHKSTYLNRNSSIVELKGTPVTYYILGLFAVVLILIFPQVKDSLSFFVIRTDLGNRINENLSPFIMLGRQIVLTAVILIFISIAFKLKLKYELRKDIKYYYLTLLLALLNISIIVGERRILQVYTAFATAYVLIILYPQFKKKIVKNITLITLIVLGLMSVYKFFNAFLFESYIDAIEASSLNLGEISYLLQVYFAGPQNVATSVDIVNHGFGSQPLTRLLYDIFRSTMGFNFLVKDIMYTTNDVFNSYIYGRYVPSGQPVSGIGYGYMYFGFIFAPIISVLLMILALFFERVLIKTTSLELKYIFALIIMRMGSPFSSLQAKLNITSLILLSIGLVYLFSRILRMMTRRGNEYSNDLGNN